MNVTLYHCVVVEAFYTLYNNNRINTYRYIYNFITWLTAKLSYDGVILTLLSHCDIFHIFISHWKWYHWLAMRVKIFKLQLLKKQFLNIPQIFKIFDKFSKFSKNFIIFHKFSKFPKKLKILKISKNFQKIWKFKK